MMRRTIRRVLSGSMGLLLIGLLGMSALLSATTSAQEATPVLGSREVVGSQSVELDGKNRIWQINRVTALPEGEDSDEFLVREGFIYAHDIPVSVTIDRDEPILLEVGDAIALENKDQITVVSGTGTLGSFYTIELINPLDINTDANRQVIGAPFETTSAAYTMDLTRVSAEPGVATTLDAIAVPALVLVLDGDLIHAREDRSTTALGPGNAGSGTGSGSAVAGSNGTTFLLATLSLPDDGTPEGS